MPEGVMQDDFEANTARQYERVAVGVVSTPLPEISLCTPWG